jgi:hypothetical protein
MPRVQVKCARWLFRPDGLMRGDLRQSRLFVESMIEEKRGGDIKDGGEQRDGRNLCMPISDRPRRR